MKIFYPILFFLDALLLVWLAFFFLKELDKGGPWYQLGLLISAIIACISGLVILLGFYFKSGSRNPRQQIH